MEHEVNPMAPEAEGATTVVLTLAEAFRRIDAQQKVIERQTKLIERVVGLLEQTDHRIGRLEAGGDTI